MTETQALRAAARAARALAHAEAAMRAAQADRAQAARAAHTAGATYGEIGAALGVTRARAHQVATATAV